MVFRIFYRGNVVSLGSKETLVDLFELYMVDFDVILEIDWLHPCNDSPKCQTRKVIFKFPNESVIG